MLRLLACMLASVLALLPVSAQTMQQLGGQTTFDAQTMQLSPTSFPVEHAVQSNRAALSDPMQSQSRTGRLAAVVFRVLASQNTITLDGPAPAEMDAVLRPPESDASGSAIALFSSAKKLYDSATSYRTERAVVKVDPLGLKCRLSVNLGRLGAN